MSQFVLTKTSNYYYLRLLTDYIYEKYKAIKNSQARWLINSNTNTRQIAPYQNAPTLPLQPLVKLALVIL